MDIFFRAEGEAHPLQFLRSVRLQPALPSPPLDAPPLDARPLLRRAPAVAALLEALALTLGQMVGGRLSPKLPERGDRLRFWETAAKGVTGGWAKLPQKQVACFTPEPLTPGL